MTKWSDLLMKLRARETCDEHGHSSYDGITCDVCKERLPSVPHQTGSEVKPDDR